MKLLLRSARRDHARHPVQALLAVLGVAVGVAVVLAVDLANQSAERAFTASTESLVGRATHRIDGAVGQGLPDELVRVLRVDAGVPSAAPRITGSVRTVAVGDRPTRQLTLLGIDPLAERDVRPWLAFGGPAEGSAPGPIPDLAAFLTRPGAVLATEPTQQRLALSPGDSFTLDVHGVSRRAVLVGTLSPPRHAAAGLTSVLVADLATAQELLQREGVVDAIDLCCEPSGSFGAEPPQLRAVRRLLPPGARVATIGAATGALSDLTHAFRTNLQALSLLALLVGAFLIFNTVQFSVVRRRRALGTLRALGAQRRQVFAAVLVEAGLLGVLGTALGCLLGPWLARGLVGLVAQTINDLYFTLTVTSVVLPPAAFAKAVALGVTVCVVAAVAPAFEATRVPPRDAMLRTSLEGAFARSLPRSRRWALLFGGVGALLLAWPTRSLVPAYGGLLAVLLGAALLVPTACSVLLRHAATPLRAVAGVAGSLAARGAAGALSRTAVAVAALMLAVAASVGLGAMIGSFRSSVASWLATSLRADVYITTRVATGGRNEALILPEVLRALRETPSVASSFTYRRFRASARRRGEPLGEVQMVGLQTGPQLLPTFELLAGDAEALPARLGEPGGVMISEPLAYRLQLGVGDTFDVRADAGDVALTVVAVFRDFASEHGIAMIDRDATYHRHWADRGVSSLAVFGVPAADADALAVQLDGIATAAGQALSVQSSRGLRVTSLEVFDRTFAITGALRMLCLAVAFLGVFCAIMSLSLDRQREVGLLRALGALPRQITALVLTQTALLGLCAGVLALPVGVLLGWLLTAVINRRSFGWTLLDLHLPVGVAFEALALACGAAVLAAVYPTWRFARTPMVDALREEE
ncbi:MAG: FtsX-like permease family protein [Planctomycetota bacterium]